MDDSEALQKRIGLFMRVRGYTKAQIHSVLSVMFPPSLLVDEEKKEEREEKKNEKPS